MLYPLSYGGGAGAIGGRKPRAGRLRIGGVGFRGRRFGPCRAALGSADGGSGRALGARGRRLRGCEV